MLTTTVFLLSRMHEAWRPTPDPVAAVREGLATSGSVIIAAAAVMVVGPQGIRALAGPDAAAVRLGLAAAILIDAVVIRCVAVPAVLHLLGSRAWSAPCWLARTTPRRAVD